VIVFAFALKKGSLGAAAKLLPCDHKVMDSSIGNYWKLPLIEMQGKVVYIRSKVVGSSPNPNS
jgi:hypothetical protein